MCREKTKLGPVAGSSKMTGNYLPLKQQYQNTHKKKKKKVYPENLDCDR